MPRKRAVTKVKSPVTWILVADARRAQVYSRRKVEKLIALKGNSESNKFDAIIIHGPVPVKDMQWQADSPEQYEARRKRMGAIFRKVARVRSGGAADTEDKIWRHFARRIADNLNKAGQKGAFNRLVLIGPSHMLAEIKKHLNEKALKHVMAELPKDVAAYNEYRAGRASG